jgi:putative DNA primase/helicase
MTDTSDVEFIGLPDGLRAAARMLVEPQIRRGFQPAGLHEYRDAEGLPLYWRIRMKHVDGRKWIRPMRRQGGRYAIGEPPEIADRKPLYRLDEIAGAEQKTVVWFVEGESCADALANRGLLATTAGSASSDEKADFAPLAGRTVRLWADNDVPGREHAQRVADKLLAIGCTVERVKIDRLHLADHGDVVDWLAAHPGATLADLQALPVEGIGGADASSARRVQTDEGVRLLRGDAVTLEAYRWLWSGWLAIAKLHVLAGAPGTGKTTLAVSLGATITTGGRWPDGSTVERGDVVIWTGEDGIADTLAPRFVAAGADMSRVHFVEGARDAEGPRPFDPATDMPALARALAELPAVKLLILDPIVNAVGTADSNKNAEVRRALAPVVDLAERLGVAVLGISHFTKGSAGRDPVERVTGSLAFGALARIVLAAAKIDAPVEDGDSRLFARAKCNIALDTGGFGYRLESVELRGGIVTSRVVWGSLIAGTARELLAGAEVADDESADSRDAAEWLRELLGAGPMMAKDVEKAARESGLAWRTVQRARARASVVTERDGFGKGARYVWSLPMRATSAPCAPRSESGEQGVHGGEHARPSAPDPESGVHGAHGESGAHGGTVDPDDCERF